MSQAIAGLISRAVQYRRESKLADAGREWTAAIELSRQLHDEPALIPALTGAAQNERDLGRDREALAPYQAALLLCRKYEDPLRLAHTVRHLGDVQRHLAQYQDAHASYAEALNIYLRESRKRILWIWQIRFVRLRSLKSRRVNSKAPGLSGARLAASISHSALRRGSSNRRTISPGSATPTENWSHSIPPKNPATRRYGSHLDWPTEGDVSW